MTEQQKDRFTKYMEWIAESSDFDLPEALVLSRVYQWPEGCWESYGTIARKTKLDRRTVIRAVIRLIEKGWLSRRKTGRGGQKVVLTFNVDKLLNLPLYEDKTSVRQTPVSSSTSVRESPQPVSGSHPNIYSRDKVEEIKGIACDVLKRQNTNPSKTELERSRQRQRQRLGL